uniref:Uncharacterized protein n=1 Tax=Leviviridae sp. TaxID=2027243 RepID=A0A514D9W5_9VIRU|nr:MAG: hypothetical protein H1Rhizo27760_000003 [Leviviridae sp.]
MAGTDSDGGEVSDSEVNEFEDPPTEESGSTRLEGVGELRNSVYVRFSVKTLILTAVILDFVSTSFREIAKAIIP